MTTYVCLCVILKIGIGSGNRELILLLLMVVRRPETVFLVVGPAHV